MSTTALFFEHLIAGLQATVWLLLLILLLFGFDWMALNVVQDFMALLTFVGLAIAYPIGIFVDELADFLFKPWMKRIRRRRYAREGVEPDAVNMTAFYVLQRIDDEFLKTYFNYIRTRIRVSRSSAFNLALMTLMGVLFTLVRLNDAAKFIPVLMAEILMGSLLTGGAIWVWREVTDTFSKQIVRAYQANPDAFRP